MNTEIEDSSRRDFMTGTGAAAGLGLLASAIIGGAAEAHEFELNAMQPRPEQIQKFMALPDGPVVMVNLIKFKEGASDEYKEYGRQVNKILKKIGAEMIFQGTCGATLIGGAEWDAVALVRYPDRMALIKMAQSPEYQAIHMHRADGLEGQMNLAVYESNVLGE